MQEKPDYYYNQSAVIPYRGDSSPYEILMITSRKKKRWVIPKGIIEPNLSAPDSAAKEAVEEAGLEGFVSDQSIGSYQYEKWGGTCKVQVYTMQVHKLLDEWLESNRDREWVNLETAVSRVNENQLKEILRKLPAFLNANQAD
ncbi:MAG: NUDIX hydrolase [Gammaproteobacteria bacterium]|nr:NUDIX hydrolase [Gammaproteobacteria bacterium]